MLLSLALTLLVGMLLGEIFKKIHLPPLLGMIIAGLSIGPYALNLLDEKFLSISPDLREIALIIILMRAGLTLSIDDLRKVGRPAILMSFIPAILEIGAMIIFAPKFFGVSVIDAALMGTVVAAVSPAVIVPKMITIIKEGYGTKKAIPQMILASATIDDVFVIILFSSLLSLSQGSSVSLVSIATIPVSIIAGIVFGVVLGVALTLLFKKIHLRDSKKVLVLLSLGFTLLVLESVLENTIPFSALIAIMFLGIVLRVKQQNVAMRMSDKFSKLWVFAEIVLFVLVGASVNMSYALQEGVGALGLIFLIIIFRMFGVCLCLLKTPFTNSERLFCMIAYIPKATVQAAIGRIPLMVGLSSGDIILTVAVLSILITAPLGSILIEYTYKKLLRR